MILVTGATGTVGREVVKALSGSGRSFRAGYRTRPQNVPPGVEAVALDFDQPETLAAALRGVETLFLLSSAVAHEANAVGEAARAGVKRIVKLSVRSADQEEFTFAKWHRAMERAMDGSGLAWTFLRPNSFMQNVVNYMGQTIRTQGAIYTAAPDAPVSHLDARDIGQAAARVLTEGGHESQAYELDGPEPLTYHQMAASLTRALGREVRCVPISDEDHRQGALSAGAPAEYAEALVDLERFFRTGHAGGASPDLGRLLGRALTRFDKFADDYASALR